MDINSCILYMVLLLGELWNVLSLTDRLPPDVIRIGKIVLLPN